MHPGFIFALGVGVLALSTWKARLPLPLGLLAFAIVVALLSGVGLPYRHLVEGGFGYINLVLALFAGAFFGQAMLQSGAADRFGAMIAQAVGHNRLLALLVSGILLYVSGMFVGVAGVAVLATGVFVPPILNRVGISDTRIAAFIAILATCGMIAPPVNVPAMAIADGVNMPYAGFDIVLFILSAVPAVFTVLLFAFWKKDERPERAVPVETHGASLTIALLGLVLTLGFWAVLRLFPTVIPDPAVPIVLVIGALVALPALGKDGIGGVMKGTFGGTPLVLAAVLIAVGIAVQIMTLTGVRGWLVITAMSLPHTSVFVEMLVLPLFGSVLTSMGAANVIGVPFAFSLIHQDMIVNVAAISAFSALSEFMPPTAIATALACYVVGNVSMLRVLKHCVIPALVIAVTAALVLIFADQLGSWMATSVSFQH